MYKVFLNDIPIILSTEENYGEGYVNIPIKKVKIKSLIKDVKKGQFFYVNLFHKKEEKLLKHLKKKLKTISAGGGLVLNEANEILFIYRNDRWDLPKGGKKRRETMEECAVREVMEETGIDQVQIEKFLTVTYHIMKRKGKYRLKETFWFEMCSNSKKTLQPQLEEGITKVKWKSPKKAEKALSNTYANIKELFSIYQTSKS